MDPKSGRDGSGRFSTGNKLERGRPRGTPNQTSVDMLRIPAEVAPSLDRVDGQTKLVQLAEDDFTEYLCIVVNVMPKASQVDVSAQFVERQAQLRGEQSTRFINALEARSV